MGEQLTELHVQGQFALFGQHGQRLTLGCWDHGSKSPILRSRLGRLFLRRLDPADLGDFLTYRIGEPRSELTNAPRGGARYPCEAVLVGKTYAQFHIDVGVGDALVGDPEPLTGDDVLDFAGIEPAKVLAISKPQQFAEKAHAYSFPWSGRFNTRTKDLVDLVMLIERGLLNLGQVRSALKATFETRRTHPLPENLSPPPVSWATDFPGMAAEAGLSTTDSLEAFAIVNAFWESLGLPDNTGVGGVPPLKPKAKP